MANPEDSGARRNLEATLSQVESQPNLDQGTLMALSRGHAAAGDTAKAIRLVDSVLTRQPTSETALNFRRALIGHR
jgi:hypothetical protein